ncbi:hypothetical protein BH10ACI2_BH10ACI2_02840 [soil metagenome]
MKNLAFKFTVAVALCLFISCLINAQVPQIDSKAGSRVIVVTDDNFEPQKQMDRGPTRRGRLLYEVWITTDGILHCKTSKLSSAAITFSPPTIETANAGGGTKVGGSKSRMLNVGQGDFSNNHYLFNINADKYREMHMITLSIISSFLGSAEVKLINKKIPAEISK